MDIQNNGSGSGNQWIWTEHFVRVLKIGYDPGWDQGSLDYGYAACDVGLKSDSHGLMMAYGGFLGEDDLHCETTCWDALDRDFSNPVLPSIRSMRIRH